MKKANIFVVLALSAAMVLSGCSMSNTAKGAAVGTGGGAALGAGIGALANGGKGAAWGAAIGAVVGGTAGTLIGHKMDKQKAELEKIEGAQVESVNNGEAIRVTFDSGILFGFNSSKVSTAAQTSLTSFASSLKQNPDTDITIKGYTDNVGSESANLKVSADRANNVAAYLQQQGVPSSRISTEGKGFADAIADNSTEEGRAKNRRVEIFIMPNEKMVQEAQAGTLK